MCLSGLKLFKNSSVRNLQSPESWASLKKLTIKQGYLFKKASHIKKINCRSRDILAPTDEA
ncbi:hypothetical protein TUM4445_23320 [Shewanella sp. MBTL60-112-B2]|nr:hypothetical protein TUM4444_35890 [Shewanella sp. MBTL60-112-B1]GIU34554.1 hypothetical protein TUM4445_23320 [Shewanella sp. MBTL60-112-B2]